MYCFNRHQITSLLLAILIATILLSCAYASVVTFNLPAGEEIPKPLDLSVDDHVVIKVSAIGGEGDNTIDFFLNYPNGTTKKAFVHTGDVNYAFICDVEGQYTLIFSNVASTHDKFISLNYEIEHYILGMPQMFILTVIIAIMCVAAVAVFIFMGKTH